MMVKRTKFKAERVVHTTKLKQIIDVKSIAWNDARRIARGNKARSMYASDYGQCMRKTWFQFFPEDYPVPVFDPRTLRIFHNGEDVHERLTAYLKQESSLKFEAEIDIPRDDLDVHGRCDGMCVVDERPFIVEFKSINRSTVYVAKEEHIGQCLWYMAMWRLFRRELKSKMNIDEETLIRPDQISSDVLKQLASPEKWALFSKGPIRGEIIYESKQTQETFHFPVEMNEELYKRIRSWYEQLKEYIENKQRPDVSYPKDKFPCSWGRGSTVGKCAFYDVCWQNDNM